MSLSLQQLIAKELNFPLASLQFRTVGGGCINQTFRLSAPGKNYFCKVNAAANFPQLFSKEANALKFIALQKVIKTPEVQYCIETGTDQVLILEWINSGPRSDSFWKNFGCQLAAFHTISNDKFGWKEANYMGSVVQQNKWTQDWITFFTGQRLIPLAQQCLRLGLLNNKHLTQLEKLGEKVDGIFSPEAPALLHGDLWNGNLMCNENEEPVLIDPAIYFGHRSIDLGMTTLFGGFDKSFYEAYHYHFPLPTNYAQQWKICNLYPLLIHLLLFGSSYKPQIEQILKEFI